MYEIESGIAIPDKAATSGKYPWKTLEVGQSFFVPQSDKEASSVATKKRVYSQMIRVRRETGRVFYIDHATKTYTVMGVDGEVVENTIPGVRVWRVEGEYMPKVKETLDAATVTSDPDPAAASLSLDPEEFGPNYAPNLDADDAPGTPKSKSKSESKSKKLLH